MNAKEMWESKWSSDIHLKDSALKRMKSALSAKMTPVHIDYEEMFGYFQGTNGRYETFLDECPCVDFRRHHLPCKHIYRLAIELGVIEGDAKSDITKIPVPKSDCATLSETIDIVESLSESSQGILLEISCSSADYVTIDDSARDLLESGLLDFLDPEEIVINWKTKKDLLQHLSEMDIHHDAKMKFEELKSFCVANCFNDMLKIYGRMHKVRLNGVYSARNIHLYLHRKFYYGLDKKDKERAMPLSQIALPDDEITSELVKRGYCNPKNVRLPDSAYIRVYFDDEISNSDPAHRTQ